MSPALKLWLSTLMRLEAQHVMIVPGGGKFADQVRVAQKTWFISDQNAHDMALLAMQQMALLFQGIEQELGVINDINAIPGQLKRQSKLIWSPDYRQLQDLGLDVGWDVSSDSLAAWLAHKLKADALVLVKSAQIPEHWSIRQLQSQKLVDRAFDRYCADALFMIKLFHRNQVDVFSDWVNNTYHATTKK